MAKNQEKTKNDIYNYLKSNGYEPVYKSTNGKEVSVPEEAEVIQFQFKLDGHNYGTAGLSLDNEGKLKIYYSDKIETSPTTSDHGEMTWKELIPNLRRMTFGKVKSFELDDMDNLEYDMAKREHSKKLEEGYYPMGKKASYSDNIPECKIIIKHNRNIEEGEQRYRNIHQIFIENQLGERFLAPTQKPGLARVYARHIAEGGKVNDDKWNHITSLCEEYTKMAGFVRATRNGQFNEDTQRLVSAGLDHYLSLRESLHKLAGKRGYNSYFESYTPALMESETDEGLSEMFVNSSLDPRIESVIPILNRLNKNISENQEIKQTIELEEWADSLLNLDEGVVEGSGGKVVFSGTGDDGGKYEIIQSGPTDFMIHANGKHIDTYSSLQRAMSVLKNEVPGLQKGVAEGWQDDILAMAKTINPNARMRGTPEQEKQRTMDMLAQRKKEREEQEKLNAQQDFANIHELEKEYHDLKSHYDSLGGSSYQYADREQNLSDNEREARNIAPQLSRLHNRIQMAKKIGNTDTLSHVQKLSDGSDLEEDIGPQQKAVGQLGATSKVNAGGTILGGPLRSQKGLRGKLVGGATESVDPMLSRIKKLSGL